MKIGVVLVLVAAILAAIFVSLPKEQRVGGVELLEDQSDVEDVMFDVLAFPLTEEELELFLGGADSVLDWAEDHPNEWVSAGESLEPLVAVRELKVWRREDLDADEFSLLLAKVLFTLELQADTNSVEGMKKELAEMEMDLRDTSIPAEHRELIREGYEQFEQLIGLAEKVGPVNRAVYLKHQDRVDALMLRFDAVGE
ncbi:MAG: hypothetical protein AAGB46_06225 [Verrucomicrobiota bacterium]